MTHLEDQKMKRLTKDEIREELICALLTAMISGGHAEHCDIHNAHPQDRRPCTCWRRQGRDALRAAGVLP